MIGSIRPALLLAMGMAMSIQHTWAWDVVRDGKPDAQIVLAAEAPAGIKLAAEDLQSHIQKISGAKLPIVQTPREGINRIYIGDGPLTEQLGYRLPAFTSSGYDILVRDHYAILTGPNTFYPPAEQKKTALGVAIDADIGARHAVSALLERWGVRFYAPYEDGTIIPRHKTLSLEIGRETRQAAFRRRAWFYSKQREDTAGMNWFMRLKSGVNTPIYCNSNLPFYTEKAELHAEHPQWYAQAAPGKPLFGHYLYKYSWIPRYSDPGFQQASAQWLGEYFEKNPHLMQSTMGAPDGTGNPFDYRDVKKYQRPGMSHWQAYANMLWDYHSAVARELEKTHPDKYLIWWCLYNNSIPTNIDLATQPHNILVRTRARPTSAYAQEAVRKQYYHDTQTMWEAFKPRDKTLQWDWMYDYQFPKQAYYPEFYPHALQELRQWQRQYYDGFFTELNQGNGRISNLPALQLMIYVDAKLRWNPDLDLEALLDEYYHLWFGPAAAEMKAFHEYAEEVWGRPGSRSVSTINGFLKQQDIPHYFELLDAAKAKTSPDSVYYRRIDAMEKQYGGLKTLFKDRTPTGPILKAGILPDDAQADGDLSKYTGDWQALTTENGSAIQQNRTQFQIALSQDRSRLFVAVRCDEANMKGLVEKTVSLEQRAREADPQKEGIHSADWEANSILGDDHVQISLNTPDRNYFVLAVNPLAEIRQVSFDVEIINRDALPTFWRAATQAHVNKFKDRWEMELMIPTEDFGGTGPSREQPWGVNVSRVRMAGGDRREQALTPPKPADWARLSRDK